MLCFQEEKLRQAQKSEELRRKKASAQDEAERAAVLEELRSLDTAVSEARERLRRYEVATASSQAEADNANAAAAKAEERRNAAQQEAEEIAAAMGQNVDGLLAGEVTTKGESIELDERYEATVLKIYRESVIFELPAQQNGAAPHRCVSLAD